MASCLFAQEFFCYLYSYFVSHWPTVKVVPPLMRRLHAKQMFRTWMKTLLHCWYKYLLNLLVTLVVTYKK